MSTIFRDFPNSEAAALFPEELPSYSFMIDQRSAFTVSWADADNLWLIAKPGETDCFARYSYPERRLVKAREKRILGSARLQDTEGVIALDSEYAPDGAVLRRTLLYVQQSGSTRIGHPILSEYVNQDECSTTVWTTEREVRRSPSSMYHSFNSAGRVELVAASPEFDQPGFDSWSIDSFEVERSATKTSALGIAGRFDLDFGDIAFDCVRIVQAAWGGWFPLIKEHYVDESGRPVLIRSFFGHEARARYSLGGETVKLNGEELYHAFDVVAGVVFGA